VKYDFEFSWDSTYGYAARLVGDHADRGLVVDLGAGLGTFAQPLVELGFDYLGLEHDAESVAECRRRGLDCEQIDLRDTDALIDRVRQFVADRTVVAVSLLDVVEHLPEPEVVLAGLAALLDALAGEGPPPLLVLSIPNVSHADLAAKLAFGRWDVTDVGLLDNTHITLFTHDRLDRLVEAAGLIEVGRNDVVFAETEQRFPIDHPAVAQTPLSSVLRTLRLRADAFGHTYQFVRCYRRGIPTASDATETTRCSVVVASTGGDGWAETLDSLAVQTESDFDVCLVAPTRWADGVAGQVETLPTSVRARIRVEAVESERRVDLLNAGLERAAGALVMFLSAGDVLAPEVIERLSVCAAASPGHVLRFEPSDAPFDLLRHLVVDETPLDTVAFPTVAVNALGLRFVEIGEGLDGWDFVWRAASALGVVECPVDVSSGAVAPRSERRVPPELPASMDHDSLVLPPGSAPVVRRALVALNGRHDLESQLEIARQRIDALERSRYWRMTAPIRRLTAKRPSLRFWRSRGAGAD
jgi:SAM-dependent methyltransferase